MVVEVNVDAPHLSHLRLAQTPTSSHTKCISADAPHLSRLRLAQTPSAFLHHNASKTSIILNGIMINFRSTSKENTASKKVG